MLLAALWSIPMPDLVSTPPTSAAALVLAVSGLASATLPQFVAAYRSWLADRRLARASARQYLGGELRKIAGRLDALEAKLFGPGAPRE